MLRLLNETTPATAERLFVPDRVPPFGFAARATVTLFVAVATRLPKASRISAWTPGVISAPASVVLGSTKNATRDAAAGVMSKSPETSPVSPLAEAASEYPVPLLLMLSVENDATPATADTVAAPERVPPVGLSRMASVTLVVALVTRFPIASSTSTFTAGAID